MRKILVALFAVAAFASIASTAPAAGAATKQVTIVHVQKGCHVWSMGATKSASLSLSLRKGTTLAVVNQDLDMHRVVQVSGPAIYAGPFMMMNRRVSLRFAEAGHYRFQTRVADMRGMPKAETIGPDNKLVLTVDVT